MIDIPIQNFTIREHDVVSAIVIYGSGDSAQEILSAMRSRDASESYHYVIDQDGTVYGCVEDAAKAFHCRDGVMNNDKDVSEFSVGIVLAGKIAESRPEQQLDSLLEICTRLAREHHIPLNRIQGGSHVRDFLTENPLNFPWFEFLNTLGSSVLEMILTGSDATG